MKTTFELGAVPSVHSLVVRGALSRGAAGSEGWQMKTAPGYGSLVRMLKNGEVAAAILPFEWFADRVARDSAGHRLDWRPVLGWDKQCLELILSKRLAKRLRRRPEVTQKLGDVLTIGIDGYGPLCENWIRGCLRERSGGRTGLRVQHLPTRSMNAGLALGVLDGVILPAPWSQTSELKALGIVEGRMSGSGDDLGMVLVGSRVRCGGSFEALESLIRTSWNADGRSSPAGRPDGEAVLGDATMRDVERSMRAFQSSLLSGEAFESWLHESWKQFRRPSPGQEEGQN